MVFTKEDLERIGKNIASIRKAFGYMTQMDFALALDPNGHFPGLSHDMIKKYESGKYPITEKTVRLISSLTFFTFEEIVHDDLSDLEPNSLNLDSEDIANITSGEELNKDMSETLKVMFPIFKSKFTSKDKNFERAIKICEEKLNFPNIKEQDVDDACKFFQESNCPESYLNILSIIGRLFFNYYNCGMRADVFEKLKQEKFESFVEYTKRVQNLKGYEENAQLMAQVKRALLDKYNGVLTHYMIEAAKYNEYKDFVYYYLAIRYYIGLMDNDITKLTDTEMNTFAINMIECLDIIGNKYAKAFLKAIKE